MTDLTISDIYKPSNILIWGNLSWDVVLILTFRTSTLYFVEVLFFPCLGETVISLSRRKVLLYPSQLEKQVEEKKGGDCGWKNLKHIEALYLFVLCRCRGRRWDLQGKEKAKQRRRAWEVDGKLGVCWCESQASKRAICKRKQLRWR